MQLNTIVTVLIYLVVCLHSVRDGFKSVNTLMLESQEMINQEFLLLTVWNQLSSDHLKSHLFQESDVHLNKGQLEFRECIDC